MTIVLVIASEAKQSQFKTMNYLYDGFVQSVRLIGTFDKELFQVVFLSLKVTSLSILFAILLGLPLGFLIYIKEFFGKRVVVVILNTLLSFPTVTIGLVVYMLLSMRGPLGVLNVLYTPVAIIVGQTILALPIIATLILSAFKSLDKRVLKTAQTMGANSFQTSCLMLREAKYAVLAAIITSFGRIVGEVGVSMMVGGNIKGYTRTMTTAIAMETNKGDFALAVALGTILLFIALLINILLYGLQKQKG